MRRRFLWVGLGSVLVIGVCISLAYLLFPFYKEDVYRKSLETGFSAAIGRTVKIEGPISLTFSLQPRFILEKVHVANLSRASQEHVFQANHLEIQVSLGPLLQRRIKIENIVLDGAVLLLEESSDGLKNWHFGSNEGPSIWSNAVPHFSIEPPESGKLAIENLRIAYQSHRSDVFYEMTIHTVSVMPIDERLREISLAGKFRDVPFEVAFKGGHLVDLFDLSTAWPIDGVLSTNNIVAAVRGKIGGPNPDHLFDLEVQIHGDRLSALNDILRTDLPESAPFKIDSFVVWDTGGITLSDLRATLGTSDFMGQLSLQNRDARPMVKGEVTARTLQLHDFFFSSPHADPTGEIASKSAVIGWPASLPFDADLGISINQWLVGQTELGSVSLTASVHEDHVRISPVRINSFGGTVDARIQMELTSPQPSFTVEANVTSLHYADALRSVGISTNINGVTDCEAKAGWNGITWPEILKSLTVNLRTDHTTFGIFASSAEPRLPVVLRQGSLRILNGGPVNIFAKGQYREQHFGAQLQTGAPVDLNLAGNFWPVSLTVQSGGARLEVQGKLEADRPDFPGAFNVSLKGGRLNELDPDFSAVGPYALKAQVRKDGSRYEVGSFRSRFGSSDLSGTLEVNLQSTPPHLKGALTSKKMNVDELSSPGDIDIPSEALRAIDIDLKMVIDQLHSGNLELAGLVLNADLQAGRLKVESVEGTLLGQKSAYGNVRSDFVLDAARAIPTLSGHVALDHVRYERLFPGVRFLNLPEHAIDLDVRFSSAGPTMFTMLKQLTVRVKGEKLHVQFHRGAERSEPVQLNANLTVASVNGSPMRFHADGIFEQTAFRLRAVTAPPRLLLEDGDVWPLNVALEVPHAMAEAIGYLNRRHPTEEFTFKVLAKGENVGDWQFLGTGRFPDVGPLEVKALLIRTPVGFHVTNLEGLFGESPIEGDITFSTKGVRPRVTGNLTVENVVMGTGDLPQADATAKKKKSMMKTMTDSVKDLGAKAIGTLTDSVPGLKKPMVSAPRVIPDMTFPIETLRAVDLLLDGEVKHVRKGAEDLGQVAFRMLLDDGLFTMQLVTGMLWGGTFDGKIVLDGAQYVPTLDVSLNLHGLDYGRVTRSFGGTEFIKGQSQSITLRLNGRGDTLHEVLSRANGQLDLVDGPLELTTKYIDLWAADFLTTAFSTAWEPRPVTKLNCMVGYFDIDEGKMKSDDILIDTSRLTVAGVGQLNLGDETMDLILTPRPKDPSLFNLAHMVRIAGPLSDPDVTRDKFRIAESGAWGLLGLVNPLGWAIAIPQIAGTTVGTMKRNPCEEAMKSRQHTAQAIEDIKGGLWGKIKKTFSKSSTSSEVSPERRP